LTFSGYGFSEEEASENKVYVCGFESEIVSNEVDELVVYTPQLFTVDSLSSYSD
jgi:hypothetical protein